MTTQRVGYTLGGGDKDTPGNAPIGFLRGCLFDIMEVGTGGGHATT